MARRTTTSPASKPITSRTGPAGAGAPAGLLSAAMPRTPARCTAAITRHTARIATLADQCETTMFMTAVAAGRHVSLHGLADPFRSKQVEQHPEEDSHHREVVPDQGEGTQRRLETLHGEGFRVSGRLLHERDTGQRPDAHH